MLLLPVCWLFHNSNANWHYHQLPNGQLVKHAHPFQSQAENNPERETGFPFENHHHSEKEIFFLGTISDFHTIVVAECCTTIPLVPENSITLALNVLDPQPGIPMRFPFLRAPPLVMHGA